MFRFAVPPVVELWLSRISCIISALVIALLFVHQKYKLAQRRKELEDNAQHKRVSSSLKSFFTFTESSSQRTSKYNTNETRRTSNSLVFSYILMICSFLTLSACIFIEWTDSFAFYHAFYPYESYLIAIGYAISKFCLYILLSYRIEESFFDSTYSYNKPFIWLFRIFLTLGVCVFIGGYLLFTRITETETVYPAWIPIYAVIFDFVACLINLILFTRQLWSFTNDCSQYTSTQSVFIEEFKTIIKKQVLLATISIIATVLSVVVMILFGMPVFCISFDLCVTNICVILMFSWNSKYIMLCCGKCMNLVINDRVIQSVALSKIDTSRLSSIPAHLNQLSQTGHTQHSAVTPSITGCVDGEGHKQLRLTPSYFPHQSRMSPSVSVDISSTPDHCIVDGINIHCKKLEMQTTIEEEEEPEEDREHNSIDKRPRLFVSINMPDKSMVSNSSTNSVNTPETCITRSSSSDVFGVTPSTTQSSQSTPNDQSPHQSMCSKFPVSTTSASAIVGKDRAGLTTLNDVDEEYLSTEYEDDEVP